MKTVITLEIKRMLSSKIMRITVLIGLLLSCLVSLYAFHGISIEQVQADGKSVRLTGFSAINEIRRIEAPIQGEVTRDKVKQVASELQIVYSQYDSYDKIPANLRWEHIAPYDKLQGLLLLSIPKYDNTTPISPWSINEKVAENFPQSYFENTRAVAQKAFKDNPKILEQILDTINTTEMDKLQYYTTVGWGTLSQIFPIFLVFLAVLVSILFASSFSASYESGMSEVFACTRYGKTELAIAKSVVCIGISTGLYTICISVFMGINLLLYGTQGLQTSLAVERPYLFVTGTIQDLFVFIIFIGFLAILAQAALSLFFSALFRTTLASAVFSIVLAAVPFLLSLMLDKSNKLIYFLINILPASGAHSYFECIDSQYLQIGDLLIWYPNIMWLTAALYVALFSVLSVISYNRHQY